MLARITSVALLATLLASTLILATPAEARVREVYIKNNCRHSSIEVMLRANDGDGWANFGWWTVGPDSGTYVTRNGRRIVHDEGYTLYSYADYSDGTESENTGHGVSTRYKGRSLYVSSHQWSVDRAGDINIGFSCGRRRR